MTDRPAGWDHAVAVVRDLDGAAREIDALGFSLTDETAHEGGTANRLALLDDDYIELVTVRDEGVIDADGFGFASSVLRALRFGEGLAFMATRADDAGAEVARLRGEGVSAYGPFELSRQSETGALSFAIALGHDPRLPQIGLFACEHRNRDRVFAGRTTQPNGARRILAPVVVDEAPTDHHVHYAGMMGLRDMHATSAGIRLRYDNGTGMDVLTPPAFNAWYGDAPEATTPRFAALRVGVDDPTKIGTPSDGTSFVSKTACGVRFIFEENRNDI